MVAENAGEKSGGSPGPFIYRAMLDRNPILFIRVLIIEYWIQRNEQPR